MKLQDVLNDRFGSKKIQIRGPVNGVDTKCTLNNTKVTINSDDDGYDIIFRDGNTGKTWQLDPKADTIKIIK